MLQPLKLFLYLTLCIVLQVVVLPLCFDDPFKPNLMIFLVCLIALRGGSPVAGAMVAYLAGLINGTFSGHYYGLSGVSFLLIYFLLNKVSDQLYTESTNLLAFSVFLATLFDALVSLLLISLFSSGTVGYRPFLANMVPQALVSALVVYLVCPLQERFVRRFAA